jgi:GH25 family lysozyme M1 (1,4-beta-N-acetylmuramidase)
MNPTKAIDISYCQRNVDFTAVKLSGIQAVIIRNGYLGKTDTEWERHVQGALKAGLDVGTYTYIMSETPEQARREARETIARCDKYKGKLTYPVFADMESEKYMTSRFDKQSRTKILLAFLDEIGKGGYYPAVYTNPAWLEAYIDKKQIQGRYDIWLAAWTNDPNKPTRFNYGQTLWQWGLGYVNGIKGGVDCNTVYCNYPQKIRAQGKNYLEKLKSVTLAFDAAIRYKPTTQSKMLGVLTAGSKCVILEGSDTKDSASGYTYVKLGGGKEQWIVKSAIKPS